MSVKKQTNKPHIYHWPCVQWTPIIPIPTSSALYHRSSSVCQMFMVNINHNMPMSTPIATPRLPQHRTIIKFITALIAACLLPNDVIYDCFLTYTLDCHLSWLTLYQPLPGYLLTHLSLGDLVAIPRYVSCSMESHWPVWLRWIIKWVTFVSQLLALPSIVITLLKRLQKKGKRLHWHVK